MFWSETADSKDNIPPESPNQRSQKQIERQCISRSSPKLTKVYLSDNDLFVCALTACVRSSGSFRLLHMPDNGLCRIVPNASMPSYLFLTGPGSRLQDVNNARARGLRDLGKDNSGLQFHIHIMIPQRNASGVRSQRGMKESAFSECIKTWNRVRRFLDGVWYPYQMSR